MTLLYKRTNLAISWLFRNPRLEILYYEQIGGGLNADSMYVSNHDWAEDLEDRMVKAQDYHLHYLIDRIFSAKQIVRE